MPTTSQAPLEVESPVCLQSGGGFRGPLVACTNPNCEIHAPFNAQPRALQSGERPTIHTLRQLWEMRVYVERHFASGPWDSWDGRVLETWLESVKAAISDAESDIEARLHTYGEGWYRV